jgi:hypothetical protein
MKYNGLFLIVGLACIASCLGDSIADGQSGLASQLRPVTAFSEIQDKQARSVALFTEAAKVITHPRCLNCHPATRQPTQGDDLHPHILPMFAGNACHGIPGLPCGACHGIENFTTVDSSIPSIPGAGQWALAPGSMAWQGKTPHEICEQIKDPKRNGGRSLTDIHKHMATDKTVGWAWHPGAGRTPAPGTQAQLGQLIQAWIVTGAFCPQS